MNTEPTIAHELEALQALLVGLLASLMRQGGELAQVAKEAIEEADRLIKAEEGRTHFDSAEATLKRITQIIEQLGEG